MPSGEARLGGCGEAWCPSPVGSISGLWDKLGFKTGLLTGLSEVITGASGLGRSDPARLASLRTCVLTASGYAHLVANDLCTLFFPWG